MVPSRLAPRLKSYSMRFVFHVPGSPMVRSVGASGDVDSTRGPTKAVVNAVTRNAWQSFPRLTEKIGAIFYSTSNGFINMGWRNARQQC